MGCLTTVLGVLLCFVGYTGVACCMVDLALGTEYPEKDYDPAEVMKGCLWLAGLGTTCLAVKFLLP